MRLFVSESTTVMPRYYLVFDEEEMTVKNYHIPHLTAVYLDCGR